MKHSVENLKRAASESGGVLMVTGHVRKGCGAPVKIADTRIGHISCGTVLQGFGNGPLFCQLCPACEELRRKAAATRPSDIIKTPKVKP